MRTLFQHICVAVCLPVLTAGLTTNAHSALLAARTGVSDSVTFDISGLIPGTYEARYITQENLPNMIFPFLWPNEDIPVNYAIAQGAVLDVSDGDDVAQIQQAGNTWSNITNCTFSFQETAFDGSWGAGDGSNELGWIYNQSTWDSLGVGSGVIGVTYSWESGGSYSEFDILFNGVYYYWYADSNDPYYDESDAMHVGHIALHEMGHGAGLEDIYNPGQSGYESWMGSDNESLTMYGYTGPHDEDMTLSWADMEAMRLAYPIPEPSTVALLATGLACLLFMAWRRRRG